MTASKNPENINVQLLNSFGDCPVYIFPYGWKSQPFLPKCGLFHQVPDYLPVQNVWRTLKIQEMKGFKSRKLRPRKLRPPNIFLRKALFSSVSLQLFLGEKLLDDCIQKSWEYKCTTVKQFCCLHPQVWLKAPTIFTKMWTFSSSPRLFASAECLKSVKNLRNEGFEEVEN